MEAPPCSYEEEEEEEVRRTRSPWIRPDAMNLQNRGLFDCDCFGHLFWMSGRDGCSTRIPGMSLWDRLCNSVLARQVTVEALSRKRSLELRLLYGVVHGTTWSGRWGYEFRSSSPNLPTPNYLSALTYSH